MVIVKVRTRSKYMMAKAHGKGTKAVTWVRKGKGNRSIEISKELSAKNRRKTILHEVGHQLTNKANLRKRIPQKEKKQLVQFTKYYLGPHRKKRMKQSERINEALAILYQMKKQRKVPNPEALRKQFPVTNKILNEARKKKFKIVNLRNGKR